VKREIETAVAAVRQAANVCRAVQQQLAGTALEKRDRSPVTVADFASQALICRAIHEVFPDDPIVGEEDTDELRSPAHAAILEQVVAHVGGVVPGATTDQVCEWIDYGNGAPAQRFWTLDPVDGTKGFLRGEQYAIALALIVGGQVEAAALCCPNLQTPEGELGSVFTAVRGGGAMGGALDGGALAPIAVSDVADPRDMRSCESVEKAHSSHSRSARVAEAMGTTAEPVRLDSQAKYAVVATGRAEAYMRFSKASYNEKIWDHAAGYLVCSEAGGRASDVDGKPLDFSCGRFLDNNHGVIVTNGKIHDALIAAIASTE